MNDRLVFTILGCGSSGGVPRIGGHWGDCDPSNPKNRRQRCSLLVERISGDDVTRVLIDTSPDLRNQLLDAQVGALDGVVFTHAHADHTHGIDDLRMVVINMRKRIPIWADQPTRKALEARFDYAFQTPPGSSYPPILEMNDIDGAVTVNGAGGPVTLTPFLVEHGAIDALGFRIADLAYLPDVSAIPDACLPLLQNLDVWILDALRRDPHPTHFHYERALDWLARMAPKQGVLTNMHIDLDYQTLCDETPDTVIPAYDGMQITLPL